MNPTKTAVRGKAMTARRTGLRWFDWAAFALIGAACYLLFMHGDIMHTAGSSISYLNGHLFDFYDWNESIGMADAYMPSTYILFAIWGIPLKLFGVVDTATMALPFAANIWYKLLPVCVFLLTGWLFYKTALLTGAEKPRARMAGYLWLTTPIAFFSPMIQAQYDVFTVCAVVAGFYFFVKNDLWKFTLCFAVALTFKYYSLVFYLPLILLKEKRIPRLILHACAYASAFALETLIYLRSSGFRAGVFGFGADKAGYLFIPGFDSLFGNISLFPMMVLVLCALAFMKEPKDDADAFNWAVFYGCLAGFTIFGLSIWHPQWAIIAMPFCVFGTLRHKRPDALLLLDLVWMYVFSSICLVNFTGNVAENMVYMGLLGSYLPEGTLVRTAGSYLPGLGGLTFFSVFGALTLTAAVLRHPKYMESECVELGKFSGIIRLRFIVGIACFVIPVVMAFNGGYVEANPNTIQGSKLMDFGENASIVDMITQEDTITQHITGNGEHVQSITVLNGTYYRANHSNLTLTCTRSDTGEVVTSSTISCLMLANNAYNCMALDFVAEEGVGYDLTFTSDTDIPKETVTIDTTAEGTANENHYAVINGTKTSYDLCLVLYGEQ